MYISPNWFKLIMLIYLSSIHHLICIHWSKKFTYLLTDRFSTAKLFYANLIDETIVNYYQLEELDIVKATKVLFASLSNIINIIFFKFFLTILARTPAWTDRILFKTNEHTQLLKYSSVDDIRHSDHRPVYAHFDVWYQLEGFTKTYENEVSSKVCIIIWRVYMTNNYLNNFKVILNFPNYLFMF